ncbi:MAG: hypothetical protein RhofKO_17050 [Rhodothermales bacterium]
MYKFTVTTSGAIQVILEAVNDEEILGSYLFTAPNENQTSISGLTATPDTDCFTNQRDSNVYAVSAGQTYYLIGFHTDGSGTGFDTDVRILGFNGAALPVELGDFAATAANNRAYLAWETASESNNAGFQIEHSSATSDWTSLGFTAGHGTTLEAQRYTYTAENLTPGLHRFRLKQVDYDGAFEYSPEVEVSIEIADAFNLSQVYPNPFNPEASVTLSVRERQQVRVTVYDLLGREVARLFDGELASQKGQLLRLDGSQWTSGLYVVRVVGERFTATQTVTLLK